ncbi:hypothetical protein BZB76_3283 [Actinomadura pelletieri DSM 43383]|uniref:Uncharacterized protein n=1 Tax=Actinomadura pelletieri DSM 43383 TaxID=1120940 RepID=A0A495QP61_9ACTN|nr:hypothetical protein BZB76_3283 [Actinomadura pelletieri DSM 43383]
MSPATVAMRSLLLHGLKTPQVTGTSLLLWRWNACPGTKKENQRMTNEPDPPGDRVRACEIPRCSTRRRTGDFRKAAHPPARGRGVRIGGASGSNRQRGGTAGSPRERTRTRGPCRHGEPARWLHGENPAEPACPLSPRRRDRPVPSPRCGHHTRPVRSPDRARTTIAHVTTACNLKRKPWITWPERLPRRISPCNLLMSHRETGARHRGSADPITGRDADFGLTPR